MQTTYLVPTDFSDNSLLAARLAAALAARTGADVHLLHAYRPFRSGFQVSEKNEEDRQAALSEAQLEMKSFIADLQAEGTSFPESKVHYHEGDLVDAIRDISAGQPADLVVMGTTGASGLRQKVLGSNTFEVARQLALPVLIIPPAVSSLELVKVAFFTDFRNEDLGTLLVLKSLFGEVLDEYSLIHLGQPDDGDAGRQKLEVWRDRLMSGSGIEEMTCEWMDVEESADAVNKISARKSVSLLALTLVDRDFFGSLFRKSLAKEVIHQSDTPVFLAGIHAQG